LRCLRRPYVIQVDGPDCPAMPSPPTIQLRHRFGCGPASGAPALPTRRPSSAWLMTMLEQLLRFFDFKEILPHIEIDED
jgi:hypothetical protein